MKILITFLLVVLTSSIQADNKWTKTNTIMEVSWIGLHIIDWRQTLQIAENPDRFHERNPILGRHPSVRSVNRFMVIGLVTHISISIILPEKERKFWQVVSLTAVGIIATNNFKVGLTF